MIFQVKFKIEKKITFCYQFCCPPYLGLYMCWEFCAKFQDSRTNNKKSTHPFHSNSQILENNSVWNVNNRIKNYLGMLKFCRKQFISIVFVKCVQINTTEILQLLRYYYGS